MAFKNGDVMVAMNQSEILMTQEGIENSFDYKSSTLKDSKSLKITEDTFMNMIKRHD
jgi:hypothetical protein